MIIDDLDELPLDEDAEAYAEDVDLDELLDDDLTLEDEDAVEDDDLLTDPYLQELDKLLDEPYDVGALE